MSRSVSSCQEYTPMTVFGIIQKFEEKHANNHHPVIISGSVETCTKFCMYQFFCIYQFLCTIFWCKSNVVSTRFLFLFWVKNQFFVTCTKSSMLHSRALRADSQKQAQNNTHLTAEQYILFLDAYSLTDNNPFFVNGFQTHNKEQAKIHSQ